MLNVICLSFALLVAVTVFRVVAHRRRVILQKAYFQSQWPTNLVYGKDGKSVDFDAFELPVSIYGRRIRPKKRLCILSTDRRRTFSRRWVNYRRTCIDDAAFLRQITQGKSLCQAIARAG